MITEQEIKKLVQEGRRKEAIALLEEQLKVQGPEELVLMQLGELIYAEGQMANALNKFNAVLKINPVNKKAAAYVTMINDVFDFYHKDLLNP